MFKKSLVFYGGLMAVMTAICSLVYVLVRNKQRLQAAIMRKSAKKVVMDDIKRYLNDMKRFHNGIVED